MATTRKNLANTENILRNSNEECVKAKNDIEKLKTILREFVDDKKKIEHSLSEKEKVYLEDKKTMEQSLFEKEKALKESELINESTKKALDEMKITNAVLLEKLKNNAEKEQIQVANDQPKAQNEILTLEEKQIKSILDNKSKQLENHPKNVEAIKNQAIPIDN